MIYPNTNHEHYAKEGITAEAQKNDEENQNTKVRLENHDDIT